MKYLTAGKENEKTVLLLPGTCCTSQLSFCKVVPLLAKKYRVICVDYDGFDGKPGEFTTMTDITRKIERYIIERCGGEVFAAYRSSLGGSFVGLLIQRGNVHIRHGIIGSSDLDQSGKAAAKIKTALVAPLLGAILKKGRLPKWAVNMTKKKMGEKYRARYLEHFADPDIREQNYGHEELLFFEPEKWSEEFEACVNEGK